MQCGAQKPVMWQINLLLYGHCNPTELHNAAINWHSEGLHCFPQCVQPVSKWQWQTCFLNFKFWYARLAEVYLFQSSSTHCRRLTQKCVIAHPCVVDGPRISAFSYTTSNMRVFELVWHTDRFKVIVSYMQGVCISGYKQTDRSWTLL